MQYRDYGKTGIKLSTLGFGAMRLPEVEINGVKRVDEEKAIAAIHRAFELGVNYIDTAYFYHDGFSEVLVGKAIKGRRDRIILSSKSPGHIIKKPGDYRRILEEQLTRLGVDYLDFYYFHGIGYQTLMETDLRSNWLKEADQAKAEGLIKQITFSFHASPGELIQLVDLGIFAGVLCQYNFLDRSNEEAIAYAKSKGLGVVVMGPVGGGRIAGLPEKIRREVNLPVENNVELALRFVLANPNVTCALSGMGSVQMVEENVKYTGNTEPLKPGEVEAINSLMAKYRKLADLYCTGCKYCLPCPQEIDIPAIFNLYNYYQVYGIKDYARENYAGYGKNPWLPKVKADACSECGACETKCPQKIKIREQLKEAHRVLGGDD
ncbi:MAG: aldo/keto reductase [Firmicutes bacterium]|nr:aldo/keto reductase [Bacillota bacterium]